MKTIYYNGTILKMDDAEGGVQAVLVEDGQITGIGSLQELKEKAGSEVTLYDLGGRTLMPAFIDAHSHITMAAQMSMFADLTECSSVAQVVSALKTFAQEKKELCPGMVVGFGYDHNVLDERRHPDKVWLDQVSTEVPVFIIHVSGHMGVTNSAGLALAGITKDTQDPQGGKFGRMPGTREPDGYMEEAAMMQLQTCFAGGMQMDFLSAIRDIQMLYFRYGITTAQDGAASAQTIGMLRNFAQNQLLKIDVVSYPVMTDSAVEAITETELKYQNHFRIGGYKLILDGSPQGRSAWLSEPYEHGNGEKGYPWLPDEQVLAYCKRAVKEERQLLVHCNGDAASEQFLCCYEKAWQECGTGKQLRPVMVHCQTARRDQIERMRNLHMIASFFVGHVYYWGDVHLENLGKQRGMMVSSVGTALKNNVCITFHQDTPVTKPDMLHSVWCAVKRRTRKGVLLEQTECIPVYEALKAVTINAAYQYHEEDTKGSIAVGKRADLIILNKNPMEIGEHDWKEYQVDVTIKDGEVVYCREKDS